MRSFLLALQFLTVVTLRSHLEAQPGDLARARAWYGLVGALLGLGLAGLAWLIAPPLPPLAAAGVLLLAWQAASRFLHLDGVADTADALVLVADRSRALEVMKDTRIGAFGLAAVVLVLLLKFGALASLSGARLWGALVVAPALARALAAALSVLLPPARKDVGLGAATASGHGGALALTTSGLCALAAAGLAAGLAGLWTAVAVLAWGVLLGAWFQRRLGGVTGDCLGAAIESAEAVALLALAAL